MLLHCVEELDNDLGAGSDHDLALPSLFGVVDCIERIVEHTCSDHGSSIDRDSQLAVGVEVSVTEVRDQPGIR